MCTTYCYFATCGPANQPAVTGVAVCRKMFGRPCIKCRGNKLRAKEAAFRR